MYLPNTHKHTQTFSFVTTSPLLPHSKSSIQHHPTRTIRKFPLLSPKCSLQLSPPIHSKFMHGICQSRTFYPQLSSIYHCFLFFRILTPLRNPVWLSYVTAHILDVTIFSWLDSDQRLSARAPHRTCWALPITSHQHLYCWTCQAQLLSKCCNHQITVFSRNIFVISKYYVII